MRIYQWRLVTFNQGMLSKKVSFIFWNFILIFAFFLQISNEMVISFEISHHVTRGKEICSFFKLCGTKPSLEMSCYKWLLFRVSCKGFWYTIYIIKWLIDSGIQERYKYKTIFWFSGSISRSWSLSPWCIIENNSLSNFKGNIYLVPFIYRA